MSNAISIAPSSFVQKGLLSDVDVRVDDARFVFWDYDGKQPENSLFFKMDLARLDVDEGAEDQVVTNYWSMGKGEGIQLGDSGLFLLPEKEGVTIKLSKGSNFDVFVSSLIKCGIPESKFSEADGRVDFLNGLEFHAVRTKEPERAGLKRDLSGDDAREKQVLTCGKLLKAPWDKRSVAGRTAVKPVAPKPVSGKPGVKTAAPAAATAPEVAADDDITIQAVMVVDTILTEHESVDTKKMRIECFRALKEEKAEVRNAIVKMAVDEAWLLENGFNFADGVISK